MLLNFHSSEIIQVDQMPSTVALSLIRFKRAYGPILSTVIRSGMILETTIQFTGEELTVDPCSGLPKKVTCSFYYIPHFRLLDADGKVVIVNLELSQRSGRILIFRHETTLVW